MKDLSRNEIAIIKRTAKNTKALRVKRDKLLKTISEAQGELAVIEEVISSFEAPIISLTEGYTSSEVLYMLEHPEEPMEMEADPNVVEEEAVAEVVDVTDSIPHDTPEGTQADPRSENK
jgi:hypothetical protein